MPLQPTPFQALFRRITDLGGEIIAASETHVLWKRSHPLHPHLPYIVQLWGMTTGHVTLDMSDHDLTLTEAWLHFTRRSRNQAPRSP